MSLSSYIKSLRDKKGLTQEQAANELGVTTQTIMNWENNRSTPDMHNVKNISRLYGVDTLEVLRKMAEEVDGVKQEQDEEIVDVCPWVDLLPNNFDYEKLENLRLTQQEAKMLINIEFVASFCGDLANIVSQEFSNKAEAVDILNKLSFYNLCKREDNEYGFNQALTPLGYNCYYMVSNNNLFLRDIYKLSFKDFIAVCDKLELFKITWNEEGYYKERSINLISLLKKFSNGEVALNTYEKYEYSWGKYGFKKVALDSDLFKPYDDYYNELMSEFYTIEEEEWDNAEYQADREAYLKKLQFFEENKELIEGLRLPSHVEKQVILKAVPTQKTIDFLAKLNEE